MKPPTPPPGSRFLLLAALLLPALTLHAADSDEFTFLANPASARLRMAAETLEQSDPISCLNQAAEMADVENLNDYLNCFVAGTQEKLRKEAPSRQDGPSGHPCRHGDAEERRTDRQVPGQAP